jgi:predicted RNA binding protein YcfA (HicA-like mRNA interferase family)
MASGVTNDRCRSDATRTILARGSHHQYRHPAKTGLVTIAGKPSDTLAPGTVNSILKQAGLKP